MKWEISRVSTIEQIIDMINDELDQPVGILVFGADSQLKDSVYATLKGRVKDLATVAPYIPMPVCYGKNTLTMFDGKTSVGEQNRSNLIKSMHNAGTKIIIGIFVRVEPKSRMMALRPEDFVRAMQAEKLLLHPPKTELFDYFITVGE